MSTVDQLSHAELALAAYALNITPPLDSAEDRKALRDAALFRYHK